jgi:AcrR family transcriptional regulator
VTAPGSRPGPLVAAATAVVDSPWALERARQTETRELKRESVIRAAAAAFATRGVDGTSMDDLAATLGVGKPTIYRTVGDKESLVRACESRMCERFREALAEAAGIDGTGLQRVRHYLGASLRLSVDDLFGRLLLALPNQDVYSSTSTETRMMREDVEAHFREWIAADVRAGLVHPWVDPKVLTLALFATFNFIPRWYRPDGPVTLAELFERHWRVFVEGAATMPPRGPQR